MNGPVDARPLNVLDQFPVDLLDLDATELNDRLGGPTLIRCGGECGDPAVFVSVLLHGNETSGWDAIRRLVATRGLPISPRVLFFIGNVRAAAANVRTLPDQDDFNRIWDGPEHPLARALTAEIESEHFTAAIDLHNNTGKNPPFCVVTNTKPATLDLAADFSPRIVLVESPASVLTRHFEDRCPAIAVELGAVGEPECIGRAEALLTGIIHGATDTDQRAIHPPTIYQAIARIFVKPEIEFSIGPAENVDLELAPDLEEQNFAVLPPGRLIGDTKRRLADVIRVEATDGMDVTTKFIAQTGDALRLRRSAIPAMSTSDVQGIRLDCLCYLMETIDVD